ncbi:MAG TPA: inositol monophosphatase [Candidatus Dormibacteraeota bacterium]|jgi:myo-inositol-1(or 4)-monophosphatase|nr:inositol monophosphatase [Candidatus Dormibacteraeota bacterium]
MNARTTEAEARLAIAARLSREAGRLALEHWTRCEVLWKPDDSMVTEADLAIQASLTAGIEAAFPEDGVLGEETAVACPRRLGADHVWVIDPVDGTDNFGRGLPGFCVSVGVLRFGRPLCGAVYDPVVDHLFTGLIGRGACLKGRPLRVTPMERSRRSLFSIRSPLPADVSPAVRGWLERFRLRRVGPTALHLCYVGMGALAWVHDHHASLWDLAGAAPVLLEAGGVMTAPDGSPLFPIDPDGYAGEPIGFLAGDPQAHDECRRELAAGE